MEAERAVTLPISWSRRRDTARSSSKNQSYQADDHQQADQENDAHCRAEKFQHGGASLLVAMSLRRSKIRARAGEERVRCRICVARILLPGRLWRAANARLRRDPVGSSKARAVPTLALPFMA